MIYPEFRHDLISGSWVLIAPKRALRPHELKVQKRQERRKETCPFESPYEENILISQYGEGDAWRVAAIENKYPAVVHEWRAMKNRKSPLYECVAGAGHHEIVITRSHTMNFSALAPRAAEEVFLMFQDRYRALMKEKEIAYISIFQNWGASAGASIAHPHFQILAVPIIPSVVAHALSSATSYFKTHRRCVHEAVLAHELKEKRRIVFRDREAVSFAPYVSLKPYELHVYPVLHNAYFEEAKPKELRGMVGALQESLRRMKRSLKDPDYNFFIHTAPVRDKRRHSHYHWHIEIAPKMKIDAGFELGTGIEINSVDPDEAARLLSRATPPHSGTPGR